MFLINVIMKNSLKSNIDKLMELKKLFEQGILTKEEMEVEKKKILGTHLDVVKPETPKDPEQQPQVEVSVESESVETSCDEEKIPFFEKYKGYIFGGIALLLVVAVIFLMPNIKSHSDSGIVQTVETKEIVKKQLMLKGVIDETIGFSMHLQQTGNEIEGTEHYDSQNADAILRIKGTIDDNGIMTLYEYDNSNKIGTFTGDINALSYTGTFTNSRGKNMSFSSKVLDEEAMAKEEKAIKKVSEKGNIIANVGGNIYYMIKVKPNQRYDADGEDCGKLYIHNIADGTTSYERIMIPSGEPYSIEDYKYRDLKITFVLYDVGRNGFGVGNYCTEVSQYNIKTGKWKGIAEGRAKAEFIDNNRKMKITTAILINPEAEYSYEYKFDYSDEIINL